MDKKREEEIRKDIELLQQARDKLSKAGSPQYGTIPTGRVVDEGGRVIGLIATPPDRFEQGCGPVFDFKFEIPVEPPADCQDCTRALDWCAEYKSLNRVDMPYNRGGCRSYVSGRKGYKNPVQCTHCGTVYPGDEYFHEFEGEKLCCKHFGHEPGSCKEEEKQNV